MTRRYFFFSFIFYFSLRISFLLSNYNVTFFLLFSSLSNISRGPLLLFKERLCILWETQYLLLIPWFLLTSNVIHIFVSHPVLRNDKDYIFFLFNLLSNMYVNYNNNICISIHVNFRASRDNWQLALTVDYQSLWKTVFSVNNVALYR